mmetsp:Transcript_44555/g.71606  ORF Transcript_44555/g.71606 Transcript_44555/m.71606 type:complete len:379 (-) Transcript_44555:954-2090(-)
MQRDATTTTTQTTNDINWTERRQASADITSTLLLVAATGEAVYYALGTPAASCYFMRSGSHRGRTSLVLADDDNGFVRSLRSLLLLDSHRDGELLELLSCDLGGRVDHEITPHLVLREGDEVANTRLVAEDATEPIEAERQPAVRRRTVLERAHQEAKLLLGLLLGETELLKHRHLDVAVVDTDRPAADLHAVDDHVVRVCAHLAGLVLEVLDVLWLGAREGVMHCAPALLIFVPLEQREVDDPQPVEALVPETEACSHFVAELAHGVARLVVIAPEDKDHVAGFCAAQLCPGREIGGLEEFINRRFELTALPVLPHLLALHPHHSAGADALVLCELLELFYLLLRVFGKAFTHNPDDELRFIKHLEPLALGELGEVL